MTKKPLNRRLVVVITLIVALSALGLPTLSPPVAAQDTTPELTCRERAEQADLRIEQQRDALNAGQYVLANSLGYEAETLLAPCIGPDSSTGVFAARKTYEWDEVYWQPVISEFDGVSMVQVPPGCLMMGSDSGQSDELPINEVCFYASYWIDQTEVTRAMYTECVSAGGCTPTIPSELSTAPNQPINRVTWDQANAYCQWRDLQLPTEAEWEYAARGPAGFKFAWGDGFEVDRAQYGGNSNGTIAPVGSYPSGASWTGALDMTGNVAEWVRTVYMPYPYNPSYNSVFDTDSERGVRGGDYQFLLSEYLTTTRRNSNEPTFQEENVGFRCANVPADWPEHIDNTAECPVRTQRSLILIEREQIALDVGNLALAQLLIQTNNSLLAPCTENVTWSPEESEINGTTMVYVPSGCFMMGLDTGASDERPAHEVCIENGFWLDKTEVTRSQYTACTAAGVCTETPAANVSTRDMQPVNNVTWFQAQAFCEWRGGRLPTEAEWEYAGRGPENRLYPWGEGFVPANVIYATELEMADVGSKPAGASWVGALDMSGNAGEWVSSLFLPYPYTPAAEQPDDLTSARIVRGGSFYNYDAIGLNMAHRNRSAPDTVLNTNGFRCVIEESE